MLSQNASHDPDAVGPAPGPAPRGALSTLARWAFVLVPLAAVWELLAQARITAEVARPEDWLAARRYLERSRRPGDLVASAPAWTDPLARQHFAGLIPLRDAARPDATRYPRALVATLRGGEHPDFEGWRAEREERFGRVTVRTLVNPRPVRVLFDFADNLDPVHAEISRVQGEVSAPCVWESGQFVTGGGLGGAALRPPQFFQCPGGAGWNYVGVTITEDMGHRGRRCIWSHPMDAAVMVTRFPRVPMGTRLHLHHAISYAHARGSDLGEVGSPVELTVKVDGRAVGQRVYRDGEPWRAFEFDTAAFAGGEHDVRFEVRSLGPAGYRLYCFEGDTR